MDRLSKNRQIVIKPADKGRATGVLNSNDYVKEAKRQLENKIYYKIEIDLTSEHEQLINQCIDTYKNNVELEEEIAKVLKPVNSRTPIFYMPPKIHKVNLRLFQTTVGLGPATCKVLLSNTRRV